MLLSIIGLIAVELLIFVVGFLVGGIWAYRHMEKVAPDEYKEFRRIDTNALCNHMRGNEHEPTRKKRINLLRGLK